MSHRITDTIKKLESALKKLEGTFTFYLTPIIIFFGIATVIFILFELSLFTIVREINDIYALVGIWFWEIGALIFYVGSVYLTIRIHSDRARRVITITLLFFSLLSFLLIIILTLIIGLTLLKITISLIGLLSFIAVVMMAIEDPIELLNYDISFRGDFIRAVIIIILLTLNISFFLYKPDDVYIQPKSNPELIFWEKPENLPQDASILEIFADNNFSFCVAIKSADVNNIETTNKIRTLLDYNINVYIMLVPTVGLYTTLENAYSIKNLYLEVRTWLLNENLFNNSKLLAFLIDAEASDTLAEETADMNSFEVINHLTLNRPNESIILNASQSLTDFTNLVHVDKKLHGIIKSPSFYDEADGDYDLGFLFHNVYGLDITWDFSVIMSYRTEVTGGLSVINGTSVLSDLYNNIFNFYGTVEEGNINVISQHFFYISVAAAQSGGEVKANERYIFIGDTQDIFAESSYIKNKELYDDLDICRHFNEQKVFIFLYDGFMYHYGGRDGLLELANHNKQSEPWGLSVGPFEKNAIPIYYAFVNIFDRFAALGFESL